MKARKTNNGKKGGLLVGNSHEKGGIKVIVTDTNERVEVEGGEAIITKPAVEKNWKLLSKINQDAGGVPILPPSKAVSSTEYKTGGNIVLNEGSGVVINKIYNDWQKIKTEKQYKDWQKKVTETKFGTYGTLPFLEILERFEPKFQSQFLKESFYKELNIALKVKKKTFNAGGSITSTPDGDYTKLEYIKDGKALGNLTYIYDTQGAFSVGFDNSELYIDFVQVDKKNRGKGIAKELLKKAISDAKELGVEVVTLKRDAGGCQYGSTYDTFLKNLYSSVGFVETWTQKDFEQSGGEKNLCGMHLLINKQMARGGGLEPHKEVSASINASLKDVLAISRYQDLKPMEAGMLYNTFKAHEEMDKDENGMPIYYEELSPMQEPIFSGLEKKGYIQDWSQSHEFGNSYNYLTPKGVDFVDAVSVRVQTRKAVKEGSDLFPELSAIEELIPVEYPEFEEVEHPENYNPVLWHLNLKEFCHYAENNNVDTRLAGTKAKLECKDFYKYAVIKPLLHADAERNLFFLAVESGQLPYDKAVEIIKSADCWSESNRFVKQLIEFNNQANYQADIWLKPKELFLSSDYVKNNMTKPKAEKWYSTQIYHYGILNDHLLREFIQKGIVRFSDVEARFNERATELTTADKRFLEPLKMYAGRQNSKLQMKGLYVLLYDDLNEKKAPTEQEFRNEMQKIIADKLDAIGNKENENFEGELPKNEANFVDKYKKDLYDIMNKKIAGYNKTRLETLAKTFDIKTQNLVKELGELAVYKVAINIAMDGRHVRPRMQYNELVKLYQAQVSSSHRTSESITMQQYSTPIPIGFVAGLFCGINWNSNGDYFESCAGNGLMTIAGNPKNWVVNEIDPIRLKNLKSIEYDSGKPFKEVLNQDASKPFTSLLKRFDAIITNPPFNSIDALKYDPNDNFEVKSLEQLIALRTLETMKDEGKGAIIIGGHTEYDKEGRIKAGKNRSFFVYLYKHYNVVDVINISGRNLYSRQGTGFNTRIILIDGRKKEPKGFPPLIEKPIPMNETNSYTPVTSFDALWERVSVLLKD